MVGVFSKLKLLSSAKALIKNMPLNAVARNSILKFSTSSQKVWALGILLVLLLLALIATMAFSVRHARDSTAHLEIIARIQMHHQRLSKGSQQAIQGDKQSFSILKDSQTQLHHYIDLLTQGGTYRNHHIPPMSISPTSARMTSYINQWHLEEKNINLILDSQDPLLKLGRVISEINAANVQQQQLTEQLIQRLEKMGSFSNEIVAVEAMKVLVQSATQNANTILPRSLLITEVQEQLAQDRNRLSTIVQALSQGDRELRLSSIKDSVASDLLGRILWLYREIDSHISMIQREISHVVAIKLAANEIFRNSEAMLSVTQVLDEELQQQNAETQSLLNLVFYTLLALVFLAIFCFVRGYIYNARNQLLASQNEVKQTQKAILRILNDMEQLADGDLTVRTQVTEDMTGAIADSINYTIEELQALVEGVNKASTEVTAASSSTLNISSKLLAAAQHQSRKIEETTIAVLGMAESIGQVSEIAAESTKVAKQSLTTAEKGTIAVRESIEGMNEIRKYIQDTSKRIKRLGESSQEIGEIVALISDITEQTNVLALNASIQAASAGESGRGFTIIAQEVQHLAERSADATKQVSTLIKTIQGDMQDAVAAMERSTLGVTKGAKRSDVAGQALEEIENVSKHLAEYVTNIFHNTETQTQIANKVVENMEEILHVTRQTTDVTTRTTSSIKKITGFSSVLKASVSNFKV